MTAAIITTAPTPWTALRIALRTRRPVLVAYHGHQRLICPHAIGWKSDRPIVLGYQTGGHTTTGSLNPDPTRRWRCLYIDEIDDVTPAHHANQWATADNYNPAEPFPAGVIDELAIAITSHRPPTQPHIAFKARPSATC
jgi:hypothetical protein